MVSGSAAFYEISITSGDRAGEVLETDLWVKAEAIEKAKKHGKKLKKDVAVFQKKMIFSTDTGEANIDFF